MHTGTSKLTFNIIQVLLCIRVIRLYLFVSSLCGKDFWKVVAGYEPNA